MLNKKAVLLTLLGCMVTSEIFAGTLTSFSVGDVLVCFRKASGNNNLVVDAGPVATLTNLAVNQRISITQFTTNQLYVVGLNSLVWSGFAGYDTTVTTPSTAAGTLFMTKARTAINTQTTFGASGWVQNNQGLDELVANLIDNIATGANSIYNISPAYNAQNTTTAVIEPDDSLSQNSNPDYGAGGQSFASAILNSGGAAPANFGGNFTGVPENTVASTFTSGSTVARSDFYKIPNKNAGTPAYLGYFELNTNGLLSYVAYGVTVSAPTVPVIKSIVRTNGVSSVNFTTGSSGTYTLRGTNILTSHVAVTNWPAISSISGNGSTLSLQDTTTATNKFYVITAQ